MHTTLLRMPNTVSILQLLILSMAFYCCGEEGAEALDLTVDQRSNPLLWSQAVGSD